MPNKNHKKIAAKFITADNHGVYSGYLRDRSMAAKQRSVRMALEEDARIRQCGEVKIIFHKED